MIIFDLDTLSDDTHRRHFIDPKYNPNYKKRMWCNLDEFENNKYIADEYIPIETTQKDVECGTYSVFQPDWDAYNAACGDDIQIEATLEVFRQFNDDEYNDTEIQLWTNRCESIRNPMENWLKKYNSFGYMNCRVLKMRPIGNTEPAWELKRRWLNELVMQKCIDDKKDIDKEIFKSIVDFVFDVDPDSIAMWRRRGVYCFDCRQV